MLSHRRADRPVAKVCRSTLLLICGNYPPNWTNQMPLHFRIMFLLALIVTTTSAARSEDAAEAAASAYLAALAESGLPAIVDHTHPDEIIKFRQWMSPIFDLPDASNNDFLELFGESDIKTVQEMPPIDFMRTFFKSVNEKMRGSVSFGPGEVLGTVMEDDIAHVVVRVHLNSGPLSISQMQIMSFRKDRGAWKALLGAEISGMAEAIRNQIQAKAGARDVLIE